MTGFDTDGSDDALSHLKQPFPESALSASKADRDMDAHVTRLGVLREYIAPDLSSTRIAYGSLTSGELFLKRMLFTIMGSSHLAPILMSLAAQGLRLRVPGVKEALRATVFRQFCGGESLHGAMERVEHLARKGLSTILDYGVEAGTRDVDYDGATREIRRMIGSALSHRGVNFVAMKMTSIGSSELLTKIQSCRALSSHELAARNRILERFTSICKAASQCGVQLFVDAEESWIQGAIDSITLDAMRVYNKSRPVIHTTLQMYRKGSLAELEELIRTARAEEFILGIKLVRGAYLEKERERARREARISPLFDSKGEADTSFNGGLIMAAENHNVLSLCVATHNKESCILMTELMAQHGINPSDPRISFAQLLGMSDTISCNLSAAGYNVSKYVPYGPVDAVFPYLVRRAAENSSVRGQTSRELFLLEAEVGRRRTVER